MSLTPNYSFIIPTGSDAVNLLTQCYPNFTSLDSILKPIQESGVTVATDTKVGTVHQLVRTDSSCNMFRFIATGNFVSGDTFTVDGAPVTATAMDGTSIPGGAFVINQSVVCVLNNLVLTVLIAGKETSSLPASAITYDNTVSGLVATTAQDAIDELVDSANIDYDNTVSGLTATNVQSAIDELAGGSGAHGYFELWANTTPNVDFSAQTITINGFDSSVYDTIDICLEANTSESTGVGKRSVDVSFLSAIEKTVWLYELVLSSSTGKITVYTRNVHIALSGTTLTLRFEYGNDWLFNTYGSAPTVTQNNSREIPVRILGLVHNS